MIAGSVRFEIGGVERTMGPGETIVAPPGTPHTARNVGEQPVHLRIQMRPALRWQEFVERLFTLTTRDGGDEDPEIDADALAALVAEFDREVAPARQP